MGWLVIITRRESVKRAEQEQGQGSGGTSVERKARKQGNGLPSLSLSVSCFVKGRRLHNAHRRKDLTPAGLDMAHGNGAAPGQRACFIGNEGKEG